MKKEIKKKDILKRPEYPGGTKALKDFIANNLQYPKEALEQKIEGTVYLRYDIDHQGVVTTVKVLKKVGFGCDEEAIRLVKMLKFNIDKTRGVRVLYHKTIQIHFRLPISKPTSPISSQMLHFAYEIVPSTPQKQIEQRKQESSYTIIINPKT